MADLIITDSARKPIASLDDYELDLAYGSDENDFKLTCLTRTAAWKAPPGMACSHVESSSPMRVRTTSP